jgi:hypothetical protein
LSELKFVSAREELAVGFWCKTCTESRNQTLTPTTSRTSQLLLYFTRDHDNIVFPFLPPNLAVFDMILQGLESILEHKTWSVIVQKQTSFVGRVAQSVWRLATGWTVRGSNPGGGEIFRTCPDRPWGPPSLLYNGYRVFHGGRKRPGRDADPSPPSSAEV